MVYAVARCVPSYFQARTADATQPDPIQTHAVDERVTPTALRGFHFDLRMFEENQDGKVDKEVSTHPFSCKFVCVPLPVALSSKV